MDMMDNASALPTWWIPTRSATPTNARALQGKTRFSFLPRRLPLDFGDAKAAPGKGKSRRFKVLRCCTSRRNSGHAHSDNINSGQLIEIG